MPLWYSPHLLVLNSSLSKVTLCAEPRGCTGLQHGIQPGRHLEPSSPCLTDSRTERKVWPLFPDPLCQFLSPFAIIIIRLLLRNGSDAKATLDILMAAAQGCWTDFHRFHDVTDHSRLKESFTDKWVGTACCYTQLWHLYRMLIKHACLRITQERWFLYMSFVFWRTENGIQWKLQVLLIVSNQSASLTSAVGTADPVANTNPIITSSD